MKQWKKTWSLAIFCVSLIAFLPQSIEARYDGSCCDPCDETCGFEVGAEFLWWKPMVDELTYCAVRKSPNFSLKNICLDWEPGVRVTLGKYDQCSCWDFLGHYTYLESCSSKTVANEDDIFPTFAYPGFVNSDEYDSAKGIWDSHYHEWDVLVSFDNSCNECYQLSHFFGVAGIYLDQDFKARVSRTGSTDVTLQSEFDSHLWGVGLRLGSTFSRNICNCFNFFASGHGSLLAGKSDSDIFYDSQDSGILSDNAFKGDDVCRIIPGYHISAGFSYDRNICDCWDVSIKIGYEFLAWFNVPERRTFVNDDSVSAEEAAIVTSGDKKTYGFHGLFVGASFKF